MKVIILILTFNEEIHIKRCINSCLSVTNSIFVLDSYSTDQTTSIAKEMGAKIMFRTFDNHANQLNWALKKLKGKSDWVIRIDADEIISEDLKKELIYSLPMVRNNVEGIFINRNIVFLDKLIKHGGCYRRKTMRIVRPEKAICEERLMDEHLLVKGKKIKFRGCINDYSLKPLSYWIDKHNWYASKEAIEMLKLKSNSLSLKKVVENKVPWIVFLKENFYFYLPSFSRPLFYFIYRYILRGGFLDGQRGFVFHFMQSFWYRNLVDAKILEVKIFSKKNKKSLKYSIKKLFNIRI